MAIVVNNVDLTASRRERNAPNRRAWPQMRFGSPWASLSLGSIPPRSAASATRRTVASPTDREFAHVALPRTPRRRATSGGGNGDATGHRGVLRALIQACRQPSRPELRYLVADAVRAFCCEVLTYQREHQACPPRLDPLHLDSPFEDGEQHD